MATSTATTAATATATIATSRSAPQARFATILQIAALPRCARAPLVGEREVVALVGHRTEDRRERLDMHRALLREEPEHAQERVATAVIVLIVGEDLVNDRAVRTRARQSPHAAVEHVA